MCHKGFYQKHHLESHNKCHLSGTDSLFSCSYCGKTFPRRNAAVRHEKNNCDDNPERNRKVKCTICNKEVSPESLNEHIKYGHSPQNLLQCPSCEKTFKWPQQLSRHKKAEHTDSN